MYFEISMIVVSSFIFLLGASMVTDYMVISYQRDRLKGIEEDYPLTDS